MPQIEVNLSGSIKENQKDDKPAAEFSLAIKDNSVTDYDGAKRITIPKNGSHIYEIPTSQAPRFLAVLLISGPSIVLGLTKKASDATGIEIVRFFFAEVKNVDQIKFINKNDEDVIVRIFLVCGPAA